MIVLKPMGLFEVYELGEYDLKKKRGSEIL